MKVEDSFRYAVRNIRTSHLRSWLTIIGVIIGVVALVVITSISEGVQQDIKVQLEAFRPNFLVVVPVSIEESLTAYTGMATAATGKLFERDATAIKGIPGVKSVGRANYGRTSIAFKDKEIVAPVYGIDVEYYDQYDYYLKIETGRIFKDSERHVAVLANDAANVYFGKRKVAVGNIIKINEIDYRVVGIFEKIGTSLSEQDDSIIMIPYEDGKDLFANQLSKNEVNFISVEADEGADVDEIKDAIERKLIAYHKVTPDEKDFSVITADYIEEMVGGILAMLSGFLFLITLIASVVGAIGIANTMFMGVLERTKEIGVLKAVGATRWDIMSVFLVESMIIGVIGGVLGLIIAFFILQVVVEFGVPYVLSDWIIVFALVFSASVGILAGVIPARQAAKLDPVEALRS